VEEEKTDDGDDAREEAEAEDAGYEQLLAVREVQGSDSRQGHRKDDEVGDDVHDRGEVVDHQAVDADGGRHAGEGDEDLLGDAPTGEEDEQCDADTAGTSPFLKYAAVLEKEGHFGDDLREVVDQHCSQEALGCVLAREASRPGDEMGHLELGDVILGGNHPDVPTERILCFYLVCQ